MPALIKKTLPVLILVTLITSGLFFGDRPIDASTVRHTCALPSLANVVFDGIAYGGGKTYWISGHLTTASQVNITQVQIDGTNCVIIKNQAFTPSGSIGTASETHIALVPDHLLPILCQSVEELGGCGNVDAYRGNRLMFVGMTRTTGTTAALIIYDWVLNQEVKTVYTETTTTMEDIEVMGKFVAILGNEGANQTLFANGDVSDGTWQDTTGGDGDGSLFEEIDEAIVSDVDYIRSGLAVGNDADGDTVKLDVTNTLASTTKPMTVSYRMRKSAASGERTNLTVRIENPDATIACSQTRTNFTNTAFQTFSFSCDVSQITDFLNMRLVFFADDTSGGADRQVDVSWAKIVYPEETTIRLIDPLDAKRVKSIVVSDSMLSLGWTGALWVGDDQTTNEFLFVDINGNTVKTQSLATDYKGIVFDGQSVVGVSSTAIDFYYPSK